MLDLRPATLADADLLFDWANDPEARAASKSTAAISRATHDRWMDMNVVHGYPTHVIMMADTEYGAVGVVRFDADKADVMRYCVSITIAPDRRNSGLGYAVLDQACHLMGDSTLTAEISQDNVASRRIFERCGFEPRQFHMDSGFISYRRESS